MLLSALSNLTMPTPAPDGTPDSRSAAKRTADGFAELIRRYLDCAKTGTDGGQRPHVNVHINARDLAEHRDCAASPSDVDDEGSPDLDLSDLDVGHMPWTVLLDDHGAPLDAKPGKRLVNAEQRVALIARDKGCAFPGCTCVPAWTDAHHIRHWANGGPTVMNNLVLLCRSHHRLMHRKSGFVGKWEIRIGVDNKPWFIPPPSIDPGQQPRPANTTFKT